MLWVVAERVGSIRYQNNGGIALGLGVEGIYRYSVSAIGIVVNPSAGRWLGMALDGQTDQKEQNSSVRRQPARCPMARYDARRPDRLFEN